MVKYRIVRIPIWEGYRYSVQREWKLFSLFKVWLEVDYHYSQSQSLAEEILRRLREARTRLKESRSVVCEAEF